MTLLDRIAESHVRQAMERGEFDDLPGSGAPLVLEDDALVPEVLRTGYRLLKNAGCVPSELQLGREIRPAEQLLACLRDDDGRDRAERRLRWPRLRLAQTRGDGPDAGIERRYREKLLEKP